MGITKGNNILSKDHIKKEILSYFKIKYKDLIAHNIKEIK
jgi:hypothetical protein